MMCSLRERRWRFPEFVIIGPSERRVQLRLRTLLGNDAIAKCGPELCECEQPAGLRWHDQFRATLLASPQNLGGQLLWRNAAQLDATAGLPRIRRMTKSVAPPSAKLMTSAGSPESAWS